MNKYCTWREDDHDFGTWASDCGALFSFTADGPDENNFKFCYNCGKRLKVWRSETTEKETK